MRRALATAHAHPRHVVLGALVAGLLASTAPELVMVAMGAVVVVLAGRPLPAVLAVVALVAGSLFSDARLQALDAGVLSHSTGQTIESRAIVLEPVHERPVGPAVARVRLLDGPGT